MTACSGTVCLVSKMLSDQLLHTIFTLQFHTSQHNSPCSTHTYTELKDVDQMGLIKYTWQYLYYIKIIYKI